MNTHEAAPRFAAPKKAISKTPAARIRKRRWAWVGPLLVFLLLLIFIPRVATYVGAAHRDGSLHTFTLTRNEADSIPEDRNFRNGTRGSSGGDASVGGLYPSVAEPAHEPLLEDEGRFLGSIDDDPLDVGQSPVERFIVPLERALEAKERGEDDTIRRNVQDALALDRVPEVWMDVARDLLALDEGAGAGSLDDFAMGDSFDIEPTPTSAKEVADFHLEVDLSDYVLSVVRNGAILREFPVGLGYDGATPLGEFQVANKLTDPAWYNRGEVVPPGDPANPLGRRWMGLGSGGVATSYGIHPTTSADSIGQSASAGCIRMFPEDAETLFRLCPLGTRVVIHE